MSIKELLLQGQSFMALLKQMRIDVNDLVVKDEWAIFNSWSKSNTEVLKENVCIEGRSLEGPVSLFGILHFNLFHNRAVFEMQGFEKAAV